MKKDFDRLKPVKTTKKFYKNNYKLYNKDYQRLRDTSPKLPVLMQGLTELQRFYTKSN